jgi:hypothetical protein
MVESDGLVNEISTDLPIRKCTPLDFEQFYEPTRSASNKFESMRTNNQTWCFDTIDSQGNDIDLRIYGSGETEPHRRLDLSFMPCEPVVSEDPDVQCRVSEAT